jgi:UDP-4-keto-D-QuiNAc 4-reductase
MVFVARTDGCEHPYMRTLDPTIARTALVTGAGGFVGTQLCHVLAQRGWKVVGISQTPCDRGTSPSVRTESLRLLSEPERWQSAMSSIDCVVHLAARVHQMGSGSRMAAAFNEVNVDGSRFVAEQAARAGVRRFVFLSSVKVNGEGGGRLYKAEDTPDPQDPYGRSKLAAEQNVRDVCARNDMELVIIRPPLVYGPGVKANFRRLMRLAAFGMPLPFGSIENRRSLIGLYNLVDFIETCMTHPAAPGEIWLIADDECVSTPDLLRRLSRLMNINTRLFHMSPIWLRRVAGLFRLRDAVNRLCDSLQVDSSPARLRLGWRAKFSVDEELARTVAAYRDERNR